jgi:ribonuclease I
MDPPPNSNDLHITHTGRQAVSMSEVLAKAPEPETKLEVEDDEEEEQEQEEEDGGIKYVLVVEWRPRDDSLRFV